MESWVLRRWRDLETRAAVMVAILEGVDDDLRARERVREAWKVALDQWNQ